MFEYKQNLAKFLVIYTIIKNFRCYLSFGPLGAFQGHGTCPFTDSLTSKLFVSCFCYLVVIGQLLASASNIIYLCGFCFFIRLEWFVTWLIE